MTTQSKTASIPSTWLKLTIVREGRKLPLYICTDSIDSMGVGLQGETVINTSNRGWRVEETIDEIMAMMNS